jgi:acyl carrier protein
MSLVKPDGAAVLDGLRRCLPHLRRYLEPRTPLTDLRLDSLDQVELLCLVDSEFEVRLTEPELLAAHTVGDLAELIARRGEEGGRL